MHVKTISIRKNADLVSSFAIPLGDFFQVDIISIRAQALSLFQQKDPVDRRPPSADAAGLPSYQALLSPRKALYQSVIQRENLSKGAVMTNEQRNGSSNRYIVGTNDEFLPNISVMDAV